MRDSQRQRVYDWQADLAFKKMFATDTTLTLDECYTLVAWACEQYGIRVVPKITDGRRRRTGSYSWFQNRIKLPVWARTHRTVLHEAAHHIIRTSTQISGEHAPHGPEFVRVMVDLWDRSHLITRSAALASARTARVRVARTGYPKMLGIRDSSRLLALRSKAALLRDQLATVHAEIAALERGERTAASR